MHPPQISILEDREVSGDRYEEWREGEKWGKAEKWDKDFKTLGPCIEKA